MMEREAAGSPRAIWMLCALFLVLSNVYGLVTPVFEASDELYHYPYVHHLIVERRFPVQDPENVQLWKQEGGQPPLYYLIAAMATFWIDAGDLPERLVHNPHAQIGIPHAPSNKNMVIHSEAEGFPFSGTGLAVHLLRFLSTLLGAGTVWLTYRIVQEITAGAELLALAAAAVTAFTPMFLFISASVNNDNLATFLCSLTLWQLVRMVRIGATTRRVAILGVLTGLAALTKMSALGLVLPVALVITWDAWQRRSLRTWLQHGLLAACLAAGIGGWWYVRNWMLYQDPFGFNVWLAIAGARELPPGVAGLLSEFEGFRISYWGLFGGVNVLMHPLVYGFYDAVTLLALAGLLLAGRRWVVQVTRERQWPSLLRTPTPQFVQLGLLALWPLILLVALTRWTRLTLASQGRLIFPAIAAVSFWLVLGWANLVPRRWRRAALGTVVAILLVLALLTPWIFVAPAYAAPAFVSRLPDSLQPVEVTYDQQLQLVGYRLPSRDVHPGQTLTVELGWKALAPMQGNYSIFVHLYGRDDEFLGQADTYPGGGLLPTSRWSPGDQLVDTVYIPLARQANAPALGRIVVGVYHFPDMAMLPAQDAGGRDLGPSPTVGHFKVATVQPAVYNIPQTADYQLGEALSLIGYDLSAAPFEITLYWQAEKPVTVDYTVFVHLLDADGQLLAQADGQPQGGGYPTSWWAPGEVIADRHAMPAEVIEGLSSGSYTLSVGLYDLHTGIRLPVRLEGTPEGDRILLGPVTVP